MQQIGAYWGVGAAPTCSTFPQNISRNCNYSQNSYRAHTNDRAKVYLCISFLLWLTHVSLGLLGMTWPNSPCVTMLEMSRKCFQNTKAGYSNCCRVPTPELQPLCFRTCGYNFLFDLLDWPRRRMLRKACHKRIYHSISPWFYFVWLVISTSTHHPKCTSWKLDGALPWPTILDSQTQQW